MRKTIGVSLLLVALSYSAQAGEMQNGFVSPPPPPQASTAQATGEMPNMETTDSAATAIAVELLQGLLSLA